MIILSIIVPVYKTEKYIKKCLHSIISQLTDECELIVINDGSPDKSELIIEEEIRDIKNIKYIRKENGGVSSARNVGIKNASGKYIWCVDSDDYISEHSITLVLNEIKKCDDVDVLIFDTYIDKSHKTIYRIEPYKECKTEYDCFYSYIIKNGLNSIWNKVIKKELYSDNDIYYYENISLGEDSSTLIRLLHISKKTKYVHKPIYHYNLKSSGVSRGTKQNILQFKIAINQAIEEMNCRDEKFTKLLKFLNLKVVYIELVHISQKKAKEMNLTDYIELGKEFSLLLPSLVSDKLFREIPLKYQLFCYYWYYKRKLIEHD